MITLEKKAKKNKILPMIAVLQIVQKMIMEMMIVRMTIKQTAIVTYATKNIRQVNFSSDTWC